MALALVLFDCDAPRMPPTGAALVDRLDYEPIAVHSRICPLLRLGDVTVRRSDWPQTRRAAPLPCRNTAVDWCSPDDALANRSFPPGQRHCLPVRAFLIEVISCGPKVLFVLPLWASTNEIPAYLSTLFPFFL